VAEPTFNDILNAAMKDVEDRGFLTQEQIMEWERKLADAARRSFTPEATMKAILEKGLMNLYRDMVEKGKILKYHPGVARFTLEQIKPHLRIELDKRMGMSLNLIRLNKDATVLKMQQRFSGWASSVPAGGSDNVNKKLVKESVKKGISGLKYEERRVLTDQGHKLISSINAVMATQGNAIAAIWRSHYHQTGYDYREDHKDREIESLKKPYLITGSWAMVEGLVKKSGVKLTDSMTQPAEEPFCRCFYQYIYNIRQLPRDMLTAKGIEFLENSKRKQAQ
jgi:hypothetical protein